MREFVRLLCAPEDVGFFLNFFCEEERVSGEIDERVSCDGQLSWIY